MFKKIVTLTDMFRYLSMLMWAKFAILRLILWYKH